MMIPFAKYQALGNSFIVLDKVQDGSRKAVFNRLAARICSHSTGVGADGLMVASKERRNWRVDIYNADGNWAEKSGNGLRIAAMHLHNQRLVVGKRADFETGSGNSEVIFHAGNERRRAISASLGRPVFECSQIPVKYEERYFINQKVACGGRRFIATAVSIGNPHLVLFCENFDFDWELVGEKLETDPLFPRKINVGFVIVRSESEIEVRDWERGVGATQSSGTGAAAASAVAVIRGFTNRNLKVITQAGKLQVKWDGRSDQIYIKGPVEFICRGFFNYDRRI